jgi:hypothetical protein
MDKEFIIYEQALALKELGFDEPCFGFYYKAVIMLGCSRDYPNPNKGDFLETPLYQQAFRWFREKYKLHHCINTMFESKGKVWDCCIGKISGESSIWNDDVKGKYEKAEFECLKKLIEIVKNNGD